MNLIVHGDLTLEADAAGVSLFAIRDWFREALSIPESAIPFVNGQQAGPDELLPPGAELEFLRLTGRKAVGQVWTPAQFCEAFGCTREDLERWVRQGLRVLALTGEDFRITETAVDEFVRVVGAAPDGTASECHLPGDSPSELPRPAAARPRWSAAERKLYVGERLIKSFVQPADNQEAVLGEFERQGWPPRINCPLQLEPGLDPKRRRGDTVDSLNRNHLSPGILRFGRDGVGGIRWRLLNRGGT